MKKILFLILLIGFVLLSANLLADTVNSEEGIDCMGVVKLFNNMEGVSTNIIMEDSFDYNLSNIVNRNSYVQYNNSLDRNTNLNKYNNLVVSDNGPADMNNIMYVKAPTYKMRC